MTYQDRKLKNTRGEKMSDEKLTPEEIDLINCIAATPAEAFKYMRLLQESKKRNGEIPFKPPEDVIEE